MRLILLCLILLLPCIANADIRIELIVNEIQGKERFGEMVHNGVPISHAENLLTTTDLVIENNSGTQIPATFEVLSRWAGGHTDASKKIQWLLVSFPATVSANSTATYYLKTGTPVSRTETISVTEVAGSYTIDTGEAEFVISKTALTVFDSVSISDGATILSGNGSSSATINGQSVGSALAPTSTEVEREDDHYVCIKVEGKYNNTPVGTADAEPIYYKLRYEFTAGSPTAIIYHKFWWAGRDSTVPQGNVVTMDNVVLTLPDMTGFSTVDVYADSSTTLSGSLSIGETASVSQKLRIFFADAHVSEVAHGSSTETTTFATAPALINHGSSGDIAVSIDHMQYFEPQSIETDDNGKISINVLGDEQDFANLQGTWARVGVTVLPTSSTYSNVVSDNILPLNHRLIAFPSNSYVSYSRVLLNLPDMTGAGTALSAFYTEMQQITTESISFFTDEGFQGLMTWGSSPRYITELGTGTGWDKIYAEANLTDYHNTFNNVFLQFVYGGDATILYDLAFPAARRMLHTQAAQVDAEESSFYMGWVATGYDRYRSDNNSSHSYLENLFSYYYMTGDMEVIDLLDVGAASRDDYYTRDGSSLNDQTVDGDNWVNYTGRVAGQLSGIFNFLGHVHNSDYLDDFKHMFNHAFSSEVVMLEDGSGNEFCFLSDETLTSGFVANQSWLDVMYFFPYLNILYNEYGDITLGSNSWEISRVYEGAVNGYVAYNSNVNGDGTWGGEWINQAQVAFTGSNNGGTITSAIQYTGGSDPHLYTSSKSPMVAAVKIAGEIAKNDALIDLAEDGVDYITSSKTFTDGSDKPWEKTNAIVFSKLHYAFKPLVNDRPLIKNIDTKTKTAEVALEFNGQIW